MSARLRIPALLLLVVAATACARLKADEGVDPDTIIDTSSLITYLNESHVQLLDHGPIISRQLSVPGYEYTPYSGGTLQVFEYPTDADAIADIARFQRGGRSGQLLHLYRKADLVVIYWGEDPRMELALLRALGTRIA